MMKIAKMKYKNTLHKSAYFFRNNNYIVTRTLKINLELDNKFLNNNENFRKN